ncbi:MAG: 50S ribosomal protein L6 [Candidatus Nealsonbacteria bacterium]|nr:MAG: 50S ribosomal protein L6 [Candidatus Nealsonbacteria bacterium]
MSRIGKKPIEIPQGVDVKIAGRKITVKGPKGELSLEVQPQVKVEVKDGKIFVQSRDKAFWGLSRALIYNQVQGVTKGYEKKLEIEGVGYRAGLEGEDLVLNVGFSQPVKIKKPEGIQFSVDKNIITVLGIDKELVGQTAARIRKVRPPEPYKGKGIKYQGEQIRRKLGKKAVGATT